jgi:hypothetical protein
LLLQYVTLEQKISIVQCYFKNGEGLENGEWSYSTPRVFEEFQLKFPDFQATYHQQLARKVYKCVNMFLETGSVLCKKAVDDRQKEQLKILKRLNKQLLRPQINPSGDLHFFPYCVSVVHEIKPLDNKSPHNITSLNIDRLIDL